MAEKKRGLGRGLDALLGKSKPADPGPASSTEVPVESQNSATPEPKTGDQSQQSALKHIPVEFIQPGKYQPRLDMRPESLEELANSIKAQGVMQPIVVRPVASHK